MQIRRAEFDDAPVLGALVQRAIRASNSAAYPPAVIEAMCANFEPAKVLERMEVRDVFAAVDDGAIIGTVSFSLPRSKLSSLFIEPRLQRSGTGQRLVRHIEQHAAGARLHVLAIIRLDHRPAVLAAGLRDDHLRGARQRRFDLADAESPAGLKSALRGPILPRPPSRFSNPRDLSARLAGHPQKQGIRSWRRTNCCFCPATTSAPR